MKLIKLSQVCLALAFIGVISLVSAQDYRIRDQIGTGSYTDRYYDHESRWNDRENRKNYRNDRRYRDDRRYRNDHRYRDDRRYHHNRNNRYNGGYGHRYP